VDQNSPNLAAGMKRIRVGRQSDGEGKKELKPTIKEKYLRKKERKQHTN